MEDRSFAVSRIETFIEGCRLEWASWMFSSRPGGSETLYASCFACMLLHYIGRLDDLPISEKREWARYINSWQDITTGYFIGPELADEKRSSPKHSYEHVAQHLTAHVLPALSLLGSRPRYPLSFAHVYTERTYLRKWLEARDWREAWLEGNNLLFVAQFLIFLRDVEQLSSAQGALDLYFDWLDGEQDASTGLWGTNGYCSPAIGLYGGYHQLLAYYHEGRPIRFPERLIDVALGLQHEDGGFNPRGGGGACEDVDAIDILVNMYKRVDYRRPQIRHALRNALRQILKTQMPDGGFVYRVGEPFVHMGIKRTESGRDVSNLFPTWFRVHALALLGEILVDETILRYEWRFNTTCSMGWHRPWEKETHAISLLGRLQERADCAARMTSRLAAKGRLAARAALSPLSRGLTQ